MILNDSLGHKVSHAAGPQLCERCGQRSAELLVVEEPEGRAVWICCYCREPGGFSRILARRRGRYRI
jgi:hypothetical protein